MRSARSSSSTRSFAGKGRGSALGSYRRTTTGMFSGSADALFSAPGSEHAINAPQATFSRSLRNELDWPNDWPSPRASARKNRAMVVPEEGVESRLRRHRAGNYVLDRNGLGTVETPIYAF